VDPSGEINPPSHKILVATVIAPPEQPRLFPVGTVPELENDCTVPEKVPTLASSVVDGREYTGRPLGSR
jgi:hypothetical protein